MSKQNAFSLVEILVSLLVVSLAAANIAALQQMVLEQNRDNTGHVIVIELAKEKMEALLMLDNISDLENLHGTEANITKEDRDFHYAWKVVNNIEDAGECIRRVELTISWKNTKGDEQHITFAEQINVNLLLADGAFLSATDTATIITSVIKSNDVIYFDPKMAYQKGAFVIYDSELFLATSINQLGNGSPKDNQASTEFDNGWFNYGRIDNPALADNPDLQALFN